MKVTTRKEIYDAEKLIADLNEFKEQNGFSIRELGRQCGVDPGQLSNIMRRKLRISANAMYKICKRIGVNVDDYATTNCTHVCHYNDFDFTDMTIDELDDFIHKLIEIKREKISNEIKRIKSEKEALSKIEESYEKLLMETEEA